jgi:hypothetical protein
MAFSFEETQILLRTPRVGPQVIRRLEAVGLDSVAKLKTVGIEEAVGRVCTLVGSTAWRNRQRPLASALAVRIAVTLCRSNEWTYA